MLKKTVSLFLTVLLLAACLAGCGGAGSPSGGEHAPHIVVTVFPLYDWILRILGEDPAGARVTLLLDNGVDLHSFQPTAKDILAVSTCDVFVCVGGESDKWAEDVLKEASNKDMIVLRLLPALGDLAREEELAEGMQPEDDRDPAEEEGPEYDEHIWLSLRNAAFLTGVLAEALGKADPEHADLYAANAAAYEEELLSLDAEYAAAVDTAEFDTLLFADRFPFLYLTEDYGIGYYAAFLGCSAETEASFETIAFLAGKVDELGLPAVLTIEGTDHRIAETVVRTAKAENVKILTLDSMQSATGKSGESYLAAMRRNLEVLKAALGTKEAE